MAKTTQPKADGNIDADIASLSFEKALAELEDIVQRLEGNDVELEESIQLFERGNKLRAFCETRLRNAQERIEKITQDANGNINTSPLDS